MLVGDDLLDINENIMRPVKSFCQDSKRKVVQREGNHFQSGEAYWLKRGPVFFLFFFFST